jgi:SNF2 family DNA or RNA helicase
VCRVLWITDAALLEQTKAEIEAFLPDFSVLTNLDPEFGPSMKWRKAYELRFGVGPDILVLSYDMARERRLWLSHTTPALVVLDEAMKVKGKGKTFDAIHEATSKADRVLAMTATPLENNPMELYWLLKAACVPGLWLENAFKQEFVTWRTVEVGYGRREQRPVGWQLHRLPEVRARLSDVLLQRSAEDAGLQLPVQVGEAYRFVPLSVAQREAYDEAARKFGRGAVVGMEQAAKISGAESRLVDELMIELDAMGDESAIVYCEYLEVLDLVEERLTERGISMARIEGKIKEADRAAAVEAHRGGSARVLLASRVLERGLNLQHCRTLISLDSSWNPARERQREGRVRRIGSPHQTFRHLTLLPDTPLTRAKLGQLSNKTASAAAISQLNHP